MDKHNSESKNTENQYTLSVINSDGQCTYSFNHGRSLLDVLVETEITLPVHCGGSGACGACKVRIEDSPVNNPAPLEINHLSEAEIKEGIRLACQMKPRQDLTIRIINPTVELKWDTFSDENLPLPDSPVKPFINTGQYRFGLAIDLGTTQIRLSLWDMHHWERITTRVCLNPQIRFGTDILRRIITAVESKSTANRMARLCSDIIGEALKDLEGFKGFRIKDIGPVVIVGNTAMLTILSGKNYELLLLPDYWMKKINCQLDNIHALQSPFTIGKKVWINMVPPIAGFVGSDLLAAIIASRMNLDYECALLIDFGTNSEIALWDGQGFWVTSAAGGPAFDGCGISCGMQAGLGAICRIKNQADGTGFVYDVIGSGIPRGICGSGLVDAVAVLLQKGMLMPSGKFKGDVKSKLLVAIDGKQGIQLKNRDIDTFQRAKAAIGTGVACLLSKAGVPMGKLQHVFVCGAFGQHLNIQNAKAIGLLPDIPDDRFEIFGNAALSGCEQLMLAENWKEIVDSIKKRINMVDLAQNLFFETSFVDHLFLCPANQGDQ